MNKLLLTLVLILSTSTVFTNYTCTKDDRDLDCSNVKSEKVCGLFNKTINCIKAPCGNDYTSQCLACKNVDVEAVVFRPCDAISTSTTTDGSTGEGSTNGSSPSNILCTDKDRNQTKEQCNTIEKNVVCGYYDTTKIQCIDTCDAKFSNSCSACIDSNVTSYSIGSCPIMMPSPTPIDDPNTSVSLTKCMDADRNKVCTTEYKPVCGLKYKEFCSGESCNSQTYANLCTACSDKSVSQVESRECPKIVVDPPFINYECLDSERGDTVCTEQYDPVCAHLISCQDSDPNKCSKTFSNKCLGCQSKLYGKVSPGKCFLDRFNLSTCPESSRNMMCTMEYIGVCAVLKEKQCDSAGNCISYYNSGTTCQACSDPLVEKVYDAECYQKYQPEIAETGIIYDNTEVVNIEQDEKSKIYCQDSDRKNYACTKEYLGVCAYKNGKCVDNCMNTEATKCTACSNPDVEYIIEGVCAPNKLIMHGLPVYKSTVATENNIAVPTAETAKDSNNKTSVSLVLDENTYTVASLCSSSDKAIKTCTEESKPVCAYQKCISGLCPSPKTNRCQACIDSKIDFTVNMECPQVKINRIRVPCSKDISPVCYSNQVCGKYKSSSTFCLADNCKKDFTSNCDSCKNTDIESFVPVTCSTENVSIQMKICRMLLFVTALFLIL